MSARRYSIVPILLGTIAYILIIGPILIVVVTAFSSADFFVFPPPGFSLRWFRAFFDNQEMKSAFILSIELAVLAATVGTVLGTMGAIYVARRRGAAAGLIQGLFLAPIVFPTIVLGVALLLFYQLIGGVPGFLGLLIAHTVVGAPFAIRFVLASLQSLDPSLEEAGQSLGAGRFATFRFVTLPLIWPGLLAGWLFAFVISFGELNTAIFLTTPGATTLPIAILSYLQFEGGQLVIAAASALQIGLILLMVVLVERFIGLARILRS